MNGTVKRRCIDGKTAEQDIPANQSRQQKLETIIMETIKPMLGKTNIDDQTIIQQLQEVFPEKQIKRVVACKGSDRTIAPPQDLVKNEAPFRKAIVVSRADASIRVEQDWEFLQELSNRQLIRPAHAARINITMFASNRSSDNERTSNGTAPSMPETASETVSRVQSDASPGNLEDSPQEKY